MGYSEWGMGNLQDTALCTYSFHSPLPVRHSPFCFASDFNEYADSLA